MDRASKVSRQQDLGYSLLFASWGKLAGVTCRALKRPVPLVKGAGRYAPKRTYLYGPAIRFTFNVDRVMWPWWLFQNPQGSLAKEPTSS